MMYSGGIVVGNETIQIGSMANKIKEDIAFLKSRIKHLENQVPVNTGLLDNYKRILEMRMSMLSYLRMN